VDLVMRQRVFFVVCLLAFLPALIRGEVLYLKDGSSIQGKLLRLVNDTLYFETSFGSEVRVPRDQVARVEFSPSTVPSPVATHVPFQSELAGTVLVNFEKFKVSSRVSVHRDKEKAAILRANAIECALYLGSVKAFSTVDSVADEEIREGPDTVYRNDMTPARIKVAVAPGSYQCRLFLRNVARAEEAEYFVGDPLEKDLLVENVKILPGETTQLRVGMKRKMKIGSAQLFVFE
jgi:hypothetical protein